MALLQSDRPSSGKSVLDVQVRAQALRRGAHDLVAPGHGSVHDITAGWHRVIGPGIATDLSVQVAAPHNDMVSTQPGFGVEQGPKSALEICRAWLPLRSHLMLSSRAGSRLVGQEPDYSGAIASVITRIRRLTAPMKDRIAS